MLVHASNIWSWLVYDGNEKLLFTDEEDNESFLDGDANASTPAGGGGGAGGAASGNKSNEEFDLLNELRISNNQNDLDAENYFILNSPF